MCEYSQRIGKWVTEAEGRTGSQLVINVRVCQHFCLNFFFSVHSAASAVSAPWRDLSVTLWACCPRQAHDPKAQQAGRKVCGRSPTRFWLRARWDPDKLAGTWAAAPSTFTV